MAKKNNEEKNNSFFKNFIYNYKNTNGFKESCKLVGYLIFIFILLILMGISNMKGTSNNKNNSVEETTDSYGTILNNLKNNKININEEIKYNETTYTLKYTLDNNIYDGYLETINGISHFKYENDTLYEIKQNEEILNNELFGEINIDYALISKLIDTLEYNSFIKSVTEDTTLYIYNINDDEIKVSVVDNQINNILITNTVYNYNINIE